ncbi:preprotein translocase subunit SecB [Dokdonella fugitiva]|jgi:preprotein translocase subunit SecB|uniref:Protein-export protein SecB n=2 Tax=Dokdonella fugitiva TaxID=328517 RepID=A0A4R2IH07_9GAMM|nr:protein-export chaperone SecB [Dokdonella fugitiva]MBA8882913.1 preprotein translocase subunit SecB [Dokdonella fugitiva]TCO43109.1 preprotein translocase subunit SecB [Dokdonella fugitiva]
MADNTNGAAAPEQNQAQLNLQRIYVKDVSFEAPGAPQIFQQQGQPNVELNLAQRVASIGTDVYEVVLSVTATCRVEDKTAYLAEVQQAGIFGLTGFDAQAREAVLATYCPNVLFPYARQVISELVQNGGFPPFFLQPINFDALYAEQMRRRAESGAPQGANA